jgi:hypothetical protein
VVAGAGHNVVVTPDGAVAAFGDNSAGQCTVPSELGPVREASAGDAHTLALRADRSVVAWGDNAYGQRNAPADLGPVLRIAAGGNHSLALRQDGMVRAWGWNSSGQRDVPTPLPNVVALAGGYQHSVALDCTFRLSVRSSPDLGNFGAALPREHRFTGLPPIAGAAVEVTVEARGDLDLASKFLVITADGQPVGNAFTAPGTSTACPVGMNRALLTMPASTYAALASDGEIVLRVEPSAAVSAAQCPNGALVVKLGIPESYTDCDGNGRNDACDIAIGAADVNRNGRLDACEIAYGDFNLDGAVNGADLGMMLGVWGIQNPPYGDLNGDSTVNGADLGLLLSRWGPVG